MMNPDYRDILFEFNAAGVEFLVIGAFAMAAHGLPRATGDIDLWVRCSDDNASRIMRALRAFGAPLAEVEETDFAHSGTVLQIGVTPRRIDITTKIDGVLFDEAWSDRVQAELGGVPVCVIGRDDLVRNKLAAGRPKDIVDVDWLRGRNPYGGPKSREEPRR